MERYLIGATSQGAAAGFEQQEALTITPLGGGMLIPALAFTTFVFGKSTQASTPVHTP